MGTYSVLKGEKPIVFFDTSCVLCNRSIQLLLKADKSNKFVIAGLNSKIGIQLLSDESITEDSVVFYHQGKYNIKSDAIFSICNLLGFPYSAISLFYLIPKILRDKLYDFISKRRKKWFGATDHCLINSTKYSGRIIL